MSTSTTSAIEDVARRLGLPMRAERIPCPRHPREAPAAVLDTRAQRFRCPLCADVEGDIVDLVAMVKGMDRPGASRWLDGTGVDESGLVHEALLSVAASSGRPLSVAARRLGVSPRTLGRLGARLVTDYRAVMLALRDRFALEVLRRSGVFNRRGNLVFYRHRLLLPYRDGGRVVHVAGLGPGEIHPVGRPIPVPFNVEALERARGETILCTSVADAVALEDWGCPAVAVPEPPGIREEWRPRFAGRRVLVLEDPAAGGPEGAEDRAAALREVADRVDVVRMPGGGRAAAVLKDLTRPGPGTKEGRS